MTRLLFPPPSSSVLLRLSGRSRRRRHSARTKKRFNFIVFLLGDGIVRWEGWYGRKVLCTIEEVREKDLRSFPPKEDTERSRRKDRRSRDIDSNSRFLLSLFPPFSPGS